MNGYFDTKDDEETWAEAHHLDLTSDGHSLRLQDRLLRARRNGGNVKSILKNYAPHAKKAKTGKVKK